MIGGRIYVFCSKVFEITLSTFNDDLITFNDEYVSTYLAKKWTEALEPVLIDYLIHKLNYYGEVILL